MHESPPARRPIPRRPGARALAAAILALFAAGGCQSMWDRVRERERIFAVDMARTQAQRDQCVQALASLDRAQARLELGTYAWESTRVRARCYEKLGMHALARGHQRLIEDFYSEGAPAIERPAAPGAPGASVLRVPGVDPFQYAPVPSAYDLEEPRFSPYARRSKIVGRVVVAFDLNREGEATRIRVLETPHPLLATWAMEAVARSELKKKADPSSLMPGSRYVTTFAFEWRWADDPADPVEE